MNKNSKAMWSVGLMTGTVLDGNIDVALLKTDGESVEEFGRYVLAPYDLATIEVLKDTLQSALAWQFEGMEPGIFKQAEERLTRAQAHAVHQLLSDAGLAKSDIAIVGFHGQTVLHRAPHDGMPGQTRQLGDGKLMARLLDVPVAYDFRSADMRAGGQGAPLSAIYHQALLRKLGNAREIAVLNLGGVANLTWWDGGEQLIAFDTGPANAPLNDFIRSFGLGDMDKDGLLAANGTVDEACLTKLLQHPYLAEPYPKSLDRFDFSATMAAGQSARDGAALLTAFTASAVGRALDLLPSRPSRLIVCGGGRHNLSMLQALRKRAGVDILPAEQVGWRGDAIEAECFAFLAVRTLRGLPISFPGTTGVIEALAGGEIAVPD